MGLEYAHPVGASEQPALAKKILIGMLSVAMACAIVSAGYAFGRHLAQRDSAPAGSASPRAS